MAKEETTEAQLAAMQAKIAQLEQAKEAAEAAAHEAMKKFDDLQKDVVVKRTTITHGGAKYEVTVPEFIYQGQEFKAEDLKNTKKLYDFVSVSVDRRTREKIRTVEQLPLIECLIKIQSSIIRKI